MTTNAIKNAELTTAVKEDNQPSVATTTNIQIIFYSMYGHVYQLAQAIAEGAKQVTNVSATLYRVLELVPEETLIRSGAKNIQQQFAHLPIATPSQLMHADAVIFGTPTRFGNMCAQMRNFLDQTGKVWLDQGLVGKVGSVFISTASQHAGQETTITSVHTTLLHHGMIIVGIPYAAIESANALEMNGGTPYGASTIAGNDGTRQPTTHELNIARFQGKHVATIARALTLSKQLAVVSNS